MPLPGINTSVAWYRGSARNVRVTRAADTTQNRSALLAESTRDGTPSALVRLANNEIALLGGHELATASRIARKAGALIAGDVINVGGLGGTVLTTDDGFSEINASNVVIAVVDTGIDLNHPAFRGRLVQGYNSFNNTYDVTDREGHGTHVAGIIAGNWNGPSLEIGGVAQTAKLMPIKASDDKGNFNDNSIAQGIVYAAQHGARIINLSLRGTTPLPLTQQAIAYAASRNVLVVTASGNDSQNQVGYPAIYDGAMAVGSSVGGVRSTFSNGGDRLDVTANGENILSAQPNGQYGRRTGTSMSTPFVVGIAALIMARHPEWTAAQVEAQIGRTALDYGTRGKDASFGHGEVDAFRAVFDGLPASGPMPYAPPAPPPSYPAPIYPAPAPYAPPAYPAPSYPAPAPYAPPAYPAPSYPQYPTNQNPYYPQPAPLRGLMDVIRGMLGC